ncbi:type II toxin-antitoxin system Phd/YefM family antitoxin [Streptomyces tendae]|uniref:type II toxin-antitoxin system Phd/YefM family antitoxin n=1 Tax=Streptomyces tendae TaxID=1932 RepID=UPI003D74BAF5
MLDTSEREEPRHVGASELRADLSAFLGAVEYAGQSLVVTRHGRPVALLLPPVEAEGEE